MGINASLRNTKPLKPPDLKKLEEENRKLKEVILSQSMTIANLKKRCGLGPERLMEEQKKEIIRFVKYQKAKGQTITTSLREIGIKRSTYYYWLRPVKDLNGRTDTTLITPTKRTLTDFIVYA